MTLTAMATPVAMVASSAIGAGGDSCVLCETENREGGDVVTCES